MKCSSCEYWKPAENEDIPGRFDHVCGHPALAGSYNDISKEHAQDGANSYSTIATGPDFGCTHFKKKQYRNGGGRLFLGDEYIGYTDGPVTLQVDIEHDD